jgi:hypothetical protein
MKCAGATELHRKSGGPVPFSFLLRESASALGVVVEFHQPIAVVDADGHLTQCSDTDKSCHFHIQVFAQRGVPSFRESPSTWRLKL